MNSTHYQELEKLISEYEEDVKSIREDKLIMQNYPKVFTMSVASYFERRIKTLIDDFIMFPLQPIQTSYPYIYALSTHNVNKPMADKMFAKLEGYESCGVETLNANKFYDLFGGQAFVEKIRIQFETERLTKMESVSKTVDAFMELLEQEEKYEDHYAKYCDIKERLERSTFDIAEQSYLTLKLKRNRVAHDYINGLTDSFEDIRNFYYDAVLYIIAMEKVLASLTSAST